MAGSAHDVRVLSNSELYQKSVDCEYLQGVSLQVNNHTIPLFLVGDSAYPLLFWLIKPFPLISSITDKQKKFNYRICQEELLLRLLLVA